MKPSNASEQTIFDAARQLPDASWSGMLLLPRTTALRTLNSNPSQSDEARAIEIPLHGTGTVLHSGPSSRAVE